MQTLIDSGKYKVVEVLYSDSDYDVCLCSDVMVNSGDMVTVNIYKNHEAIRTLLPLFYEMKKSKSRDFCDLVTDDGCISAIFRCHIGTAFGEYFKKNSGLKYEEGLKLAETLFAAALDFDLIDDRIAAGVFSEKNAVIDESKKKVIFNYNIQLNVSAENGFRIIRLGKMLRTIFPPDRYLPSEIEELINEMLDGKYSGCASAYSKWREIQESAAKTYDEYKKESFVKYLLRKAKTKAKAKKSTPDDNSGGRWRQT